MTQSIPIDAEAAHRYFSAACFNEVWALLDKKTRSVEEDELMIAAAFCSVYHWQKRPDCTSQNLSIGYWQLSRVFAILRRPGEAKTYAKICESHSCDLSPFYRGYSLEANARAAAVGGESALAAEFKQRATALLSQIEDPAERDLLSQDLATI